MSHCSPKTACPSMPPPPLLCLANFYSSCRALLCNALLAPQNKSTLWTFSISITWELDRNADSQVPPQLHQIQISFVTRCLHELRTHLSIRSDALGNVPGLTLQAGTVSFHNKSASRFGGLPLRQTPPLLIFSLKPRKPNIHLPASMAARGGQMTRLLSQ